MIDYWTREPQIAVQPEHRLLECIRQERACPRMPAVFSHWPGVGMNAAVDPKGAGQLGLSANYTSLSSFSLEGRSEWHALKAGRMPMCVFVLQYVLKCEKQYVLLLSKSFCKWNYLCIFICFGVFQTSTLPLTGTENSFPSPNFH